MSINEKTIEDEKKRRREVQERVEGIDNGSELFVPSVFYKIGTVVIYVFTLRVVSRGFSLTKKILCTQSLCLQLCPARCGNSTSNEAMNLNHCAT